MTPSTFSAQTGGQQEGEHIWVQNVQGEHYQRNVLNVYVILNGSVGNSESSSVHRRSPKSKFLGMSLSTRVCFQSVLWAFSSILCAYFTANLNSSKLRVPELSASVFSMYFRNCCSYIDYEFSFESIKKIFTVFISIWNCLQRYLHANLSSWIIHLCHKVRKIIVLLP